VLSVEGQMVINARLDRFEAETRARCEALEHRMDRLEVRIDPFEAETRQRFDRFEAETRQRFDGIEVRFDRFEVDFGTVVVDHGRRIRALEQPGEGA
jgi:3-dehydroquinate dehydratase